MQTALISKCGSACKAGIWAMEANPRLGFTPTIPTRISLPFGRAWLAEYLHIAMLDGDAVDGFLIFAPESFAHPHISASDGVTGFCQFSRGVRKAFIKVILLCQPYQIIGVGERLID
jgi:hypothetical protein